MLCPNSQPMNWSSIVTRIHCRAELEGHLRTNEVVKIATRPRRMQDFPASRRDGPRLIAQIHRPSKTNVRATITVSAR